PSASALENKNWAIAGKGIFSWLDSVKAAAPDMLLDLPRVEPVPFVPYFEEDLGGGYCSIDLSAFNWNRKRKATHVLDPFGQTAGGMPLKRQPASAVLEKLKDPKTRDGQIDRIAHAGLRQYLRSDLGKAAERF